MDAHRRLEVIVVIARHGSNYAQIVDHATHVRKKIAYFNAVLAVALPAPRRTHKRHVFEPFFPSAAALVSAGFGSNESTCDTPPVMNRKMTRFALGCEMRRARREWIGCLGQQLRDHRRQQRRAGE